MIRRDAQALRCTRADATRYSVHAHRLPRQHSAHIPTLRANAWSETARCGCGLGRGVACAKQVQAFEPEAYMVDAGVAAAEAVVREKRPELKNRST